MHAPCGLLRRDEGAHHIDIEHGAKSLLCEIQKTGIVVDAGGADQRVNTRLAVESRRHRRAITHIAHGRHNVQPIRLQRGDRSLQTLGMAVHRHHPKSVSRQPGHGGQANALRGTGHKGNGLTHGWSKMRPRFKIPWGSREVFISFIMLISAAERQ